MSIRAILLDKDGTVLDFDRTWGPATHAVLSRLADGKSEVFKRLATAAKFMPDSARFAPGSLLIGSTTDKFGPALAEAAGLTSGPAFFARLDAMFEEECLKCMAPIGDPVAIAVQLRRRGYRLGIATNDAERAARAQARRLGLAPHVEFIAGYDSGYGGKPAPGMVVAFAAAVGVPAHAVAMVGDSAHDMAAGRAAGALTIGVLSGPGGARGRAAIAELTDHIIEDLAALPSLLARLGHH